MGAGLDDRKSARIAAEHVKPEAGAQVVSNFLLARDVLRSAAMLQGGLPDNLMMFGSDSGQMPVFFLDGEPHRRKRAEIARFFTPTAIATRYRIVMEQMSDRLLSRLRSEGRGQLDRISFELAVAVGADIVGLTNSAGGPMARRIDRVMSSGIARSSNPLIHRLLNLRQGLHALNFFLRDVRPAIAARRKERAEDVISHLVDEGYPDKAILIECMTYAAAGMVTTREFIVMAAWHLFERADLREYFVHGSEDDQFALLDEILRLEPVASMLQRRATEDLSCRSGTIPAGARVSLDIRAANVDTAVVGECPYAIDPDRAKRVNVNSTHLSFGDGRHRCPGAQVAMHETRVFLDRLFRVPGIRLERAPDLQWCEELQSYELRNAIVICDPPEAS
jgi:cytochrome P450